MIAVNRHSSGVLIISVIVAVAAMIVSGCRKRPDKVLSESEMVELMADMQLAEAYNEIANGYRTIGEQRRNAGAAVLRRHGVTPEELDSTLSWYGRNIDEYQSLYDKVDKEIERRRKKVLGSVSGDENLDDIWPYAPNMLFSPLDENGAYAFSLSNPALGKGDAVTWKMHLSSLIRPHLMLGVDYSDGTSSVATRSTGTDKSVSIRLQTDTARVAVRLYGVARVAGRSSRPLWIDSIALVKAPFDSMVYMTISSQYRLPRKKAMPRLNPDTAANKVKPMSKADSIRMLPVDDAAASGKSVMRNTSRPGSGSMMQPGQSGRLKGKEL